MVVGFLNLSPRFRRSASGVSESVFSRCDGGDDGDDDDHGDDDDYDDDDDDGDDGGDGDDDADDDE